jgi:hypothetical protein
MPGGNVKGTFYHLIHALSAINRFSPLTGESMDLLTDEQVQDIDQFILRYTNLYDTIGYPLVYLNLELSV